jgi:iron complex outermembrane recepter protein
MGRVLIGLFLVGMMLSTGLQVYAQEEAAPLEEIVVTGEKLVTPTKQTGETVYTGKEITRKGMEIEGSKASTSVYEAADMLPGINVESPDPFGLAAEQRNVRVRGVRASLGAMSVEGVPNYGGNPIGPREYIYDMENMQGIAVYKGAIPSDLGTGVGGRGGVFELRPRWPEKKFGFEASQAYGSWDYQRSFFRIDSGSLPVTGTRLSSSFSYTEADKWKGPGDLGPRKNVNFMLSQPVPCDEEIKFWLNVNDVVQDLYRPLTFAQVRSLDENYGFDYNNRLAQRGTAAQRRLQNINYYLYNQADLTNIDLLSIIPVKINDMVKLTFKPYYSIEDSNLLNGSTSQGGLVTKRIRDIERYGAISEAQFTFPWLQSTVGYWYESVDMLINTENYLPGSLAFRGYGIKTEAEDNGIVHSPYVKFAGKLWHFDWQAGVKYFYYTDPATKGFTSTAPTFEPVRARDLDRDEKTYEEWLPSVGLAYNFTDSAQVYASYGRSLIRPYSYVPLINLYNQNRAAFIAAGVTLNDLFNGYAPEISDNFELGARYKTDLFEIMPAVFFSKHDNLLTTIHDPRITAAGVNYQQNIGKATGIGFELDTSLFIKDYLTFFFNPAFISLTYDEDLTFAGNTLEAKGNQVVDTPEWLIKSGLIVKYDGFEVVPMMRYVGERYADVEHKERIGDHFLADLMLSYTLKNVLKAEDMRFSLEFYNLFDKKYVSVINVSDDNRAGSTSFLPGAPFTVVMRASVNF